jgi:hypothetical protein
MRSSRSSGPARAAGRPAPGSAEPFEIAGQKVAPGTRERVAIPVAPLYIQAMVDLAAIVVHGRKPGPRLWVSAGIHGDELLGIYIVRGVLQVVDPEDLRGTLVAVPIVNAFGLLQQTRYLPDRRDLNRSFPGSKKGSLASRLARIFMNDIVGRCTHGVDLHTAAIHRDNLPQIRANLDDPATRRMAQAFAAPIMIHANIRDGSLRQAATMRGIPTLLYEAGEALRYDRNAGRRGVDGVLRVMKAIGMYDGPVAPATPPLESRDSTWARAPRSGFMIYDVDLGDRVRKGQHLGTLHMRIHQQFFREIDLEITAPISGMVVGITRNPLTNVGDALVHIARV